MFDGRGVKRGEIVESLYREIRALRIYEGATEVQKLIVAARVAEVALADMNTFEESSCIASCNPRAGPGPAATPTASLRGVGRYSSPDRSAGTRKVRFESDDLVAQIAQAMRNVVAILACDGAGPEHVTNLVWYFIDKREYARVCREIGKVYREIMGRNFPAMTAVQVSALIEDRAKVEIQATAVVPD